SAADVKIVLYIQPGKNVAIILELAGALPERDVAAVIAKLAGKKCSYRREAELSRLKEQIIQVHLAAFDCSTEPKIVLPKKPVDIIAPGEIPSEECSRRVVAETERPVYSYLLYGLRVRLEWYRDPEI